MPDASSDTLFKFDVYNTTTKKVVSSGQLDLAESKLYKDLNEKGFATKATMIYMNIEDSFEQGTLKL